eukprot:scaffold163508_cov27-Tisochrysis_lutea.AAC.4
MFTERERILNLELERVGLETQILADETNDIEVALTFASSDAAKVSVGAKVEWMSPRHPRSKWMP